MSQDINYKKIIEAILFTMGEAVPIERIAVALELEVAQAREVMAELMEEYNSSDRGMSIIELDGSFQMCTKADMYEYLIRIAKQPKKHVLTDTVLETLSIIAYKQPITRVEIERIRGVSCDHAVNKLLEYNLIQELGRLDAPGKPILFGTTEEFLRSFGVESIEELPVIAEETIDQFAREAEAEMQVEMGDLGVSS